MTKEKELPIIYLYIHSKMEENFKGVCIHTKELKSFLFQWKIPNILRPLIIKEMIKMKLLEKEGRFILKLNHSTFNPKKINELYQKFGIY